MLSYAWFFNRNSLLPSPSPLLGASCVFCAPCEICGGDAGGDAGGDGGDNRDGDEGAGMTYWGKLKDQCY